MKNANELRKELSEVFNKLKAGDISHCDAAAMANIAGKMINSAKAQIEYYSLRQEKPDIEFLESNNKP